MNYLPAFLIAAGSAAAEPNMTARFAGGDSLPGELIRVEDDRLIWNSGAFFEPHPLKLDQLEDILLPSAGLPVYPEGDHIAIATLTNGDQVRGSLLKADAKEIGLHTSFAGDLTFRRDMVDSLEIQPKPKIRYAGPTSIEEWTQSEEDGWTYENGRLINQEGQAGVSREVGFDKRYRLSFDVAWRGGARFRVFTCADSPGKDEVENGFELVCQSQYAYIRKRVTRGGRTESITIGTTGGVREFQEKEKVRVELLHDQVSGRIRLMLDDRLVSDWREPAPGAAGFGGHLHFISEHSAALEISRVQLTTWDGMADDDWQGDAPHIDFNGQPDPEEEAPKSPPRGILLANGDVIDGEATGIEDGKVTLKTPLKTFTLPVSRLRTFSLRTPEEAADPDLTWKPIRRAGDIRAHFPEGGHLTFDFKGYEEGAVRGESQTFGESDFDLSAFSRLEFNIYRRDDLE